MSPTRRDLFRRAAATVAAVSIAALPTVHAVQSPRLVDVIDTTDDLSAGAGCLWGMIILCWREWSPAKRQRYLEIMGREFPDFGAGVVDVLQGNAARRVA